MTGRLVTLTWQHNPVSNAPASYRRACKYDAFIPEPLSVTTLNLNAGIMASVSEAEQAIRSLNDGPQPALNPLARLLLRTESIASSKVEGMQIGVRELARAEARKEGGEMPGSAAVEILANIDAMVLAVDETATVESFSIADIERIHRLLMEHSWNGHIAGRLRNQQNWIGGNDHNPCGADYVPPPPEYVHHLLTNLCDTVNSDSLPPLVQAALVHAQFETIHPFDDGNGRTGRAIIQVVLRRRGIAASYVPPISVILAKSKDRYIKGLTRFREEGGDIDWIRQFAEATTSAARLARSYLTAIQALVGEWQARLEAAANPRKDSVAWRIIEILPAHPMITVPIAEVVTGGSRPSVNKAVGELEASGILLALSSGKRNRSWEAAGLLDLLGRLENGETL